MEAYRGHPVEPVEMRHTNPFQDRSDNDSGGYSPISLDKQANTKAQAARPPAARSCTSLVREWRWEFVAWLVGTIAFVAIVGLLGTFDQQPVSKWHSAIQITTMIAALSQVCQTALMVGVSAGIGQLKWPWLEKDRPMIDVNRFDRATRGVEGSFLLLFKVSWRSRSLLIPLGAFVTILMLGFSTFAQQSVSIENRETAGRGIAVIDMARTYERPKSGSPFFPEDGPAGGGVDLYMTRAMTSGFLDDYRHPSNVTGACDSEHCSWRPFSTLAICASIEDVSSSVINATNGTGFNETQFALRGVPIDPPAAKFQKTFWMDSLNLANRGEINPPTDSPAKMPALTEVYTVFFPPCNDEGNDREDSSKREQFYETQNWRAYKASFNLCIQTLQADFNITMNTTVINQEDKDIEWQKGESESDVGGEWCTERDDENLCIGNQTMQGMARELAALFVGSASLIPAGDNYFDGQWSPTLVTDVLGSDPTACDPDYLPLHGIRGFTKRMHNIAVSMSNAMRTANTSTTFTGIAWDRQPFISVQFAWFSFPALLYLATTLFFFAMLVETRRVDAPIWKSSPLALLQTMHPDNKMETLKEIEQDAQRTSVRLRYNGEMWQLRETTRRNQDQIL